MTNAEKFKEVFGFELNTEPFIEDYCIATDDYWSETCPTCANCSYGNWWNQEYKKPCCGTCRHHHFEDVDRGWVCCNSDSDHVADWTEDSESCRCWEGR
jgi:hypothetical protein